MEPEASLADAAVHAFGGRLAAAQAALAPRPGGGRRAAPRPCAPLGHTWPPAPGPDRCTGAGAGLPEAAKAAGVFWKSEREFLRQARAWTLEALDVAQPEVLEADRACKRAGSPDDLIAERLALTIAARARRLGL